MRDEWAAEICGKMESGRNDTKEDRRRKIGSEGRDREDDKREIQKAREERGFE